MKVRNKIKFCWATWTVLTVVTVVLAGCASVSVVKVDESNDKKVKGFRYYLPRPYVVVKKEFPVAGDDFLVYGELTGSKSVRIAVRDIPGPLRNYWNIDSEKLDGYITIPAVALEIVSRSIIDKNTANSLEDIVALSKAVKEAENQTASKPQGNTQATVSADGSDPQNNGKNQDQQDKIQATVSTGKAGSPKMVQTSVSEYLEIMQLPDFSEKYAINASGGLGTADMNINLEGGWLVDSATANIDNTKLGAFIFDSSTKILDLALELAQKKLLPIASIASVTDSEDADASGGELETDETTAKEREVRRPMLLRIRYIITAQPGIYPILKPQEYEKIGEHGGSSDHTFIPYPPITVVGYNVRKLIHIQAATVDIPGGAHNILSAENPQADIKLDAEGKQAIMDAIHQAGFTTVESAQIEPKISQDNKVIVIRFTSSPPDQFESKVNEYLSQNPIKIGDRFFRQIKLLPAP